MRLIVVVWVASLWAAVAADGSPLSNPSAGVVLASERTPTRPPTRRIVTKDGVVTPAADVIGLQFHSDCSDPHNKDIACSVHVVDCGKKLLADVATGDEPPEAHDVRVEAFAKAKARQQNEHEHTLHVDVSWQMPPKNNSALLKAFKLEVGGGPQTRCFVFNVTQHAYDVSSPRFHFASETMFRFSENYTIVIYSLPRSKAKEPKTTKFAPMPDNPEERDEDNRNSSEYCKTRANPQASKWTAGFRKIFLLAVARTIQIEFVAAPPHYCFEEYEVRLLDGTGLELLHSTVLRADEMKTELIGGKVVTFGEYNFTGLSLNTDYIPSVIPVETSSAGRCLCPTAQHTACSCIAADWKTVRLSKMEKPPSNVANLPTDVKMSTDKNFWFLYVMGLFVFVFAICALIFFVIACYRKYEKSGKSVRIRFISDNLNAPNGVQSTVPLIFNAKTTSVLIIYSHDCQLHEAAVLAFADLLRNIGLEVHLDAKDEHEIECNRAEYINSSIVRADKVIVINSYGAYQRVLARQLREPPIERVMCGHNDALFMQQIDLALQHVRVISVRFSYTPAKYTLFALSPLLQYAVPDNLNLLLASICDCVKNDARLSGFSADLARLHAAASRMAHYAESEPKWFEKTHHRMLEEPETREAVTASSTASEPLYEEDKEESGLLPEQQKSDDEVEDELAFVAETNLDRFGDSAQYDSAYMSADFSQQIEAPIEVLDKPRLNGCKAPEATKVVDDLDSRLINHYC